MLSFEDGCLGSIVHMLVDARRARPNVQISSLA